MLAERPTSSRASVAPLVAAALAFAAFALIAHGVFTRVPVKVDGRAVYARVGETVNDVAVTAGHAVAGDVVAVSDGRVVGRGKGGTPRVVVNGGASGAGGRVRSGDVITTTPGRDVVEPTAEETRAIPIPSRVIGTGALVTMEEPGSAGIQRVVVGTVSGDVIASETVLPAQPMVLRRIGDGDGRVVALTFDDGPWPGQTDDILAVLDEFGVPATFFMVGDRVKRRPDIARRVADAGHAVGNHTYHHADLTGLETSTIRSEIAGANKMITRATGKKVTWFRPPMGQIDNRVYADLRGRKMRPVLWTVDPQDWRDDSKASQIERDVLAAVRPGSVILLHDGGGDQRETIKALPRIIRRLRARGYDFVLLDDLGSVRARW